MKLGAAEIGRRLDRPAELPRAVLLFGEDAARVVQLRDALVAALGGPGAEADMRIDRLQASALRGDPEALETALRSQGFFPGVRVVVLSDATDAQADAILAAATSAAGPEAALVVTAGALTGRSPLRRSFEAARGMAAVECASGPADAADIAAALARHSVTAACDDAVDALARLAAGLDRLSLEQVVAKIALWQHGQAGPVTLDAVLACAPPDPAAEAERLALALMARDAPSLTRALSAQMPAGSGGVGVAIALQRFARQMLDLRVAMDDGGQDAGTALARMVPPVPRPLQERLRRLIGSWTRADLERLYQALHELDAGLRGDRREPERALVERTLLRFVLTGPRTRGSH